MDAISLPSAVAVCSLSAAALMRVQELKENDIFFIEENVLRLEWMLFRASRTEIFTKKEDPHVDGTV